MSLVRSISELEQAAARLVGSLTPQTLGATIITLSGDLGAGKTTFAKAMALSLGITEEVTSPTFVIERVYDIPEKTSRGFVRLVHIDAYRLEGPQELGPIGWEEVIAETSNLVIIEWPEMIAAAIDDAATKVTLTWLSDTERDIEIG